MTYISALDIGESAIYKLVDVLSKIKQLSLPYDSIFGQTTINIGKIQGGIAVNIVPDRAEAFIELRTTVPHEQLLSQFRFITPFTITYSYQPILSKEIPLPALPTIAPYFTELYFWAQKSKAVVFGPGDYSFAHTPNEKIVKQDILKGRFHYLQFLTQFGTVSANKVNSQLL